MHRMEGLAWEGNMIWASRTETGLAQVSVLGNSIKGLMAVGFPPHSAVLDRNHLVNKACTALAEVLGQSWDLAVAMDMDMERDLTAACPGEVSNRMSLWSTFDWLSSRENTRRR